MRVREKKANTATTSGPTTTGKAKADCSPAASVSEQNVFVVGRFRVPHRATSGQDVAGQPNVGADQELLRCLLQRSVVTTVGHMPERRLWQVVVGGGGRDPETTSDATDLGADVAHHHLSDLVQGVRLVGEYRGLLHELETTQAVRRAAFGGSCRG